VVKFKNVIFPLALQGFEMTGKAPASLQRTNGLENGWIDG